MSKHTPGPWIAEEIGMSSAGDNAVPIYDVIAGMRNRVCEYASEADARLIAAAPELLAIVSKLALLREGLDNGNSSAEDAAARLAAAAASVVAKATGGAA